MIQASVPIPKFALICGWLDANFGIKRDTGNCTILVWLLDLKFLSEHAANVGGTSNPPH